MGDTVICLGLYGALDAAERDFDALGDLAQSRLIYLHDAAVVERGQNGAVQMSDRTKHHGAAEGAILGGGFGLLALLVPPVGAAALVVGTAGGAAVGGLGEHVARGLTKHQAEELGSFLGKGDVSLVAVTDEASKATVLDAMGGALERTGMTAEVSKESLQAAVEAARSAEPGATS
jgi:uncharacterized membrane protein